MNVPIVAGDLVDGGFDRPRFVRVSRYRQIFLYRILRSRMLIARVPGARQGRSTSFLVSRLYGVLPVRGVYIFPVNSGCSDQRSMCTRPLVNTFSSPPDDRCQRPVLLSLSLQSSDAFRVVFAAECYRLN